MTQSGYGRLLTAAALSTLLLTACSAENEASTPSTNAADTETVAQPENTLATVNGKAITMDDLTFFLNARQEANPQESNAPDAILNELINRELLVTQAKADGVDQRDKIVKLMRIQNESLLANTMIQETLDSADTSEAALKAEYDTQVSEVADVKEYKASHILLTTEDEAKAVIEELGKGGVFAEVAKEKSTGPSGPQGGDLGWFNPQSMVPEFSKTVEGMKKGEITQQAVKTQFGWHVIYLEDVRSPEPPAFEDVKQQLEAIVSSKHVEKYLEDLRAKGNVELMAPPTEDAVTTTDTEETKD